MSSTRSPGRRRALTVSGATLALVTAASAMFSGSALAAPPPPPPPPAPNGVVPGTPCTTAARACVDLTAQKAWLIQNGKVVRGPVPISSGGDGQATPPGDGFRVYRKDKDHKSQEYKLPNGQPAPMPFSVFFADGGIAFHSGNPARSSGGCIHLNPGDAVAFFNNLQIGDRVQIKPGGDQGGDDGDDNGDDGDDSSGDDSSDDSSSDDGSDDDNGDDDNGDDDSGDDDG